MSPKLSLRGLVAGAVPAFLLLASQAHAAIDVTTATTGITDAQTAVTTVIGAMITFAAAIFGLKKVLHLLGGR